jgi:dynein heavy chain
VRSDLNRLERITVQSLIIASVQARDVLIHLNKINKKSLTSNDFNWLMQMRFYIADREKIFIEMCASSLNYAYEYLGNSNRLIITPLTDRCFRYFKLF